VAASTFRRVQAGGTGAEQRGRRPAQQTAPGLVGNAGDAPVVQYHLHAHPVAAQGVVQGCFAAGRFKLTLAVGRRRHLLDGLLVEIETLAHARVLDRHRHALDQGGDVGLVVVERQAGARAGIDAERGQQGLGAVVAAAQASPW
jgi:hypothetical protein